MFTCWDVQHVTLIPNRGTHHHHTVGGWGFNQTSVSAVDWTVDDDICHCHSEKQSKPGVTRISDKMKTRQEVEGTHCCIKPNETYTTMVLLMTVTTKRQQSSACFIGTQTLANGICNSSAVTIRVNQGFEQSIHNGSHNNSLPPVFRTIWQYEDRKM